MPRKQGCDGAGLILKSVPLACEGDSFAKRERVSAMRAKQGESTGHDAPHHHTFRNGVAMLARFCRGMRSLYIPLRQGSRAARSPWFSAHRADALTGPKPVPLASKGDTL